MTDKITFATISSFKNDTSAANTYNANNALIVTGANNTLSRDGTSPNQMENILDMNNNHIVNLPAPSSMLEPVRLADLPTTVPSGANPVYTTVGANVINIGSNPGNYAALNISGTDSLPSLSNTGVSLLELNASSHAQALAIGMTTVDGMPWMQSRSWFSTGTNGGGLMLNPLGGGVGINTTSFNQNFGITIGTNWTNQAPYIGPGGPYAGALNNLTIYNGVIGGSQIFAGITTYARTSTCGDLQNVNSFVWADSHTHGAWPLYTEWHQIYSDSYVYGLSESNVVNHQSTVGEINPMNDDPTGSAVLVLESGNGEPLSNYAQYSSPVGLMIQALFDPSQYPGGFNSRGLVHGIVFRWNAFDTTILNPPDAIALAGGTYQHAISWWGPNSTTPAASTFRTWMIYSNATSGTNHLLLGNTSATFSSPVVPGTFTVGTLPAGVTGMTAYVTDGTASLAWGATVTGGSSTKYLVWYNGSAWTVVGK